MGFSESDLKRNKLCLLALWGREGHNSGLFCQFLMTPACVQKTGILLSNTVFPSCPIANIKISVQNK